MTHKHVGFLCATDGVLGQENDSKLAEEVFAAAQSQTFQFQCSAKQDNFNVSPRALSRSADANPSLL